MWSLQAISWQSRSGRAGQLQPELLMGCRWCSSGALLSLTHTHSNTHAQGVARWDKYDNSASLAASAAELILVCTHWHAQVLTGPGSLALQLPKRANECRAAPTWWDDRSSHYRDVCAAIRGSHVKENRYVSVNLYTGQNCVFMCKLVKWI